MIVEYELPYYNEMQYLCLKNCFNQGMDYLGVEDSLLKLRTGLEFNIAVLTEEGKFSFFKHNLLLPFYYMNGINKGSGNDFEEIFDDNLINLPVIVMVDVFHLSYRKEYHRYHGSHAIFLTGYKSSSKEVSIIDWYYPYFYKGSIHYDDYRMARSSSNPKDKNPFSGFQIRNYWYKIDVAVRDINTITNIETNIERTFHFNSFNEAGNIYNGYYAVDKICELLQDKLAQNTENYKDLCLLLHDEFFILHRSALFSRLYYKMSNEKYSGIVVGLSIIDRIEKLIAVLERMNFYLLKGSLTRSRDYLEKSVSELRLIKEILKK